MKLYATPLSHFSRKVRILLDLYSLKYEFIDIGNVAEGTIETFNGNPLMKVPVLEENENWIIESDHIARYLVNKVDPEDKYCVQASSIMDLNIRAVLNGLMTEEVKVILARRTGVPTENYQFFSDALESIHNSLTWLENQAREFNASTPTYKEFHLTCAFEHLSYYDLISQEFPKIQSIVNETLTNTVVASSSPFALKPKSRTRT